MPATRHISSPLCRAFLLLFPLMLLTSCNVYTVKKSDLESTLRSDDNRSASHSMNMRAIEMIQNGKIYNNQIEALPCSDKEGASHIKRVKFDSKIVVVTKRDQAIKYYTKTLYIWKNEYLIGERTTPTFHGPNIYPIRLSEIQDIKIK
jgi:hypothetical protein